MDTRSESRVRMNLVQGAKGEVKFDITAEYPTPEEAERALGDAIDRVKAICRDKGLKLADQGAA